MMSSPSEPPPGASDAPPPLWAQIAQDQAECQAWYTTHRSDVRLEAIAGIEQDERERKAEVERRRRRSEARGKKRSYRAIVDEMLREVDGVQLQSCACGCGRMFQLDPGPGRPQKYATLECKWRAVKRAVKERVRKVVRPDR